MNHDFNLQFVDLVLRCLAGILFLFQGYERAFSMKANEIVSAFQTNFIKRILPLSVLKFTVHLSAYIELIGGIMLIIGFHRDIVLYLLSVQMLFVAFAFSLIRPMWDMQYYFPRFILVIILLVLPAEWDRFSVDHFLK